MTADTLNLVNKPKEKSSGNPLIKAMEDQKRIINAIRAGKKLSTLSGIKLVSPI